VPLIKEIRIGDEVIFKPTSKQAEFLARPERFVFFGGAMGGGKSYALCGAALYESLRFPGNRGVMGRRYLSDFKKTTYLTLKAVLGRPGIIKYERVKDNFLVLFNESRIDFFEFENVDKLRSLEVNWAAVDECSEIDPKAFDILQSRMPRWKLPDGTILDDIEKKIYLGSNPEMGWLYERFVKAYEGISKKDPDFAFVPSLPSENPYAPKGYVESLIKVFPEDMVKRYVFGDWHVVLEEHPIYEGDFNPDLHCDKRLEYDSNYTIYRGWDFGLTPAVVFVQFDKYGGVNILAELAITKGTMGVEKFANEMVIPFTLRSYPGATVQDYCDPSGWKREETREERIIDSLNQLGIYPSAGAYLQEDRRLAVVHWLKRMVAAGAALKLNPEKCPVLYEGFLGKFIYKKAAVEGSGLPKFEKNMWSHVHEALQYCLSGINNEMGVTYDPEKKLQEILNTPDVYDKFGSLYQIV